MKPTLVLALSVLCAASPALAQSDLAAGFDQARRQASGSRKRAAEAARGGRAPDIVRVVVFHTNDIHGHIDAQPANPKYGEPATGGAASLATLLKSEKLPWLWIDSGDWYQGTPVGNMSKGETVVDVLNKMGLTASVVGNHEWDYGSDNLHRLLQRARFAKLGSNLTEPGAVGGAVPGVSSVRVFDVAGVRIGLFGLTTDEAVPDVKSRPDRVDTNFEDYAKLDTEILREKLHANAVLAVTHMGIEKVGQRTFAGLKYEDLRMAEDVPGVDAILGGHVHVNIDRPVHETKDGRQVLITQTAGMLRSVYRIELAFDAETKELIGGRAKRIVLDSSAYPPDPEIAALVDAAKESAEKPLREVLGEAPDGLTHSNAGESPLGDEVADAYRAAAGAEASLLGQFGIRADIPAGPVTYKAVYGVMPFDNVLIRFRMRGSDLRAALEGCVATKGALCQVSGIKEVIDPAAPAGHRLKSVEIAGAPLDEARVYTLASDDYDVKQPDKFPGARDAEDVGVTCRDAIADYVRAHPLVTAPAAGRISVAR